MGVPGVWAGIAILALSAAPLLEATHRRHGVRVPVRAQTHVLDGDTAVIRWTEADAETVRILGIDTAELFPGRRNGPLPRNARVDVRGAEARGFGRGAFAASSRTELLRSASLDRFGRTLGYFFLNGRNYSVLVIEAGLSRETISKYGDNGLPAEAAEVLRAAKRAPR